MERFVPRTGLCALSLSALLSLPVTANAVVISEILYDASGTDAGNVFVELFGTPGTDLAGWSLQGVNGGDGATYKTVALNGLIPADGVFVVGDLLTGGGTNIVNADLIVSVDFQNGPDSVRLLNGAVAVDAIGYGDFTGQIFAGEGAAAPDPAAGSSLARLNPLLDSNNNFTDFGVLTTPTPGTVPSVATVPLPASLYLLGSGLALLTTRRRTH
ncbi:MAG: lamin tail domain-containing protein [Gammaproteobacteria bacterium]|nr:lamin tail domain-containing protein [Gammaproteobacteria bacterium]